jgi:Transglutaminase-like superfamily
MPSSCSRAWRGPALSSSGSNARLRRTPPFFLFLRLTAVAVAAPHLARMSLPRLQRLLEPRSPSGGSDGIGTVELDEYGYWVDAIMRRGRPLVRTGCLTRGITLYYGLRRAGADVALCFGMGSDDGRRVGHCWITLDGAPMLEAFEPTTKFTAVARLSRAGVTS